jgi:acyl-CoA thioesterase-1
MRLRGVLVPLALVFAAACSSNYGCSGPQQQTPDPLAVDEPTQPDAVSGDRKIGIAFLGDSLTAGLGLLMQEAYPALIQDMFHAEGYGEVEVLNAGISGDTTAGGLRRVEQVLSPGVRILVLALGGNDALRGLTVAQTHDNLAAIIDAAQEKGVTVVLAGMEGPTNLGEDYRIGFRGVFTRLFQEYRSSVVYVPFLLEGVAGDPNLNQADGIHPNAEGAKVMANLLYPRLRDVVDQMSGGR